MSTNFIPPTRPAALPITKTCIFKTVNEVPIHVDLYAPCSTASPGQDGKPPIMLFIHGGGWMGSNRDDYSRPLFQHFLDAGFVIASMDYRLVPESSVVHQLEDVRDVENWLKNDLSREIDETDISQEKSSKDGVDVESQRKIVVVGASAGAHLALFVPKLWNTPPIAMLILYPPTNMHILPYSGKGRTSGLTIPPTSQSLLTEATDYDAPPTQRAISKQALDYLGPRAIMSTHVFRESIIAEILVKGLRNGLWSDEEEVEERQERDSGYEGEYDTKVRQLRLPDRGCLTVEEIDEISPLYYLRTLPDSPSSESEGCSYPPTYLLTGINDEIFSPAHHSIPFYEELLRQNVPAKLDLQPGVGHAFDVWADIGSTIGEEILKPAVRWCEQWVQ